jgi:hypothetical protein
MRCALYQPVVNEDMLLYEVSQDPDCPCFGPHCPTSVGPGYTTLLLLSFRPLDHGIHAVHRIVGALAH